ncbi:hypothetical protein PFISCL1PPCAC_14346, partial [Pristionchus fissidentatus]
DRPISDSCIIFICCTIGLISLVINLFCSFLMVNICGMFIVLLFYRHQNILSFRSSFKLKDAASHGEQFLIFYLTLSIIYKTAVTLLILGINVLPIVYSIKNYLNRNDNSEHLLKEQCQKCDWIENRRNFAVLSASD